MASTAAGSAATSGLGAWKNLPSPSIWRRDASTCLVKRCGEAIGVVWIGGISSDETSSSLVQLFEWNLGKWWTLPSLSHARAACATACLRGTIYVFGGYNVSTGQVFPSGESFEFGSTHQWQALNATMETPRWHCTAVALPRPEVIVVVGGRDKSWKELNTVEAYDTSTQTWKSLPVMKNTRVAPAAVAIGLSRIMVLGGYDGKNLLDTVEAYDFNDGEWSTLPAMPLACAFVSAVSVVQEGRFVLVFGGEQDSTKQMVQIYSVRDRAWRLLEASCPPLKQGSLVTAIDQNLLLIHGEAQAKGFGNLTMSCSLAGFSINELWEEATVSRSSTAQEDSQQERPRPIEMTPSMRRLPVATVIGVSRSPSDMNEDSSYMGSISEEPQGRSQSDTTITVENRPLVDSRGRQTWYSGELSVQKNLPHGKGRMVWEFEGEAYDGEWKYGARHGFGQFTFANGDSFEGSWKMDKKWGRGSYTSRNGCQIDGKYVDDECEDKRGVMTWKDGSRYVGGIVKGKREGKGKMTFKNQASYEGDFHNNKYEGIGTFRYDNGRVYRGYFKRGKAHGQGKLMDSQGTVLYEGQWADDAPV